MPITAAMYLIIIIALALVIVVMAIAMMSGNRKANDSARDNGEKMDAYFKSYGEMVANNQRAMNEQQDLRLKALEDSIARLRQENASQIEGMRKENASQIEGMRKENSTQMENMRQTVDEKLQTTLDDKLTKSFGLVNERLEEVYKGLGEMKSVASNVGDLKKILSNVKTRGILGEVQLAAILEQIMSPSQYEENVVTKKGSTMRVEFAIRLPGDGDEIVYLPIDSKFPGDTYGALMDAYESGDKEVVDACKKMLFQTMTLEAKDIHDKYIDPPYTTDFAIMFLPFEGLYAEAVNGGMIETLQRKYKVTIAGPTTMAALLNSLQMGFNTLAIEKKSSEVWKILGAVKTEFDTFGSVLDDTQKRLNQASQDLDKLVGTRTRQIQRKLKDVTELTEEEARSLLE